MKQLTIVFIACLAMFSCKKSPDNLKASGSNFEKVNKAQFDNGAISQMVEEPDYQKQKQMYLSLTANEKLEYWQKKFADLIVSGKLNENQTLFIEDLKNTLTENWFEESSDQELYNDEPIKEKAIELFGVEDAFATVASVGMPHSALGRWYSDCACAGRSDWCGSKTSCGYDPCNSSTWGCGTFLRHSCDGLCRPQLVLPK